MYYTPFKSSICYLLLILTVLVSSPTYAVQKNTTNPYTLKSVVTADDSSDKILGLIEELNQNLDSASSTKENVANILGLVSAKNDISAYHYIWTQYVLLEYAYNGLDGGLSKENSISVAMNIIDFLNDNGVGQWVYTDEGQFKMEVYRKASNQVAWFLRESKPETALELIVSGIEYAREEDTYMYDTQVRILLNLNKQDEAFSIVKHVLNDDPSFEDFQDIAVDEKYLSWLENN